MRKSINQKILFGKQGEEFAKNKLIELGYEILETNYRIKIGEIDIIAKKENVIYCIEVKSRSSLKDFHPLKSINHRKIHRMESVTQFYLQENPEHKKSFVSFALFVFTPNQEFEFYPRLK